MKLHWTILPIIIIGVAIGTLIALYVAGQVAQQKLAQLQATANSNPLLGAALNAL